MATEIQATSIDYRAVFREIRKRRKLLYKVLAITFVLSTLYIFCIPRYYTTDTKMAPEAESSIAGGTLGSIASSFGFDLSDMETSDAITPLLYPDLMEDNGFVTGLFNIRVKTQDGSINTTYHDYLKMHQKEPWWSSVMASIMSIFPKKKEDGKGDKGKADPYILSKNEDDIAGAIRKNVKLSTDKKTGVITINVKAQDRLICKIIADSVREHLQQFISEYRTNKARTDVAYYKELLAEAKHEYQKARQVYGSYSDENTDLVLESYRAKREDLENEMQLKFDAYRVLNTQLQTAKAKVQQRTPVFTLIKGASMPVRPAGPKRMLFVLEMLILAFIATSFYIMNSILRDKK
ncbi:MAG: chain-length determining protein [Prevotella sp.]|nr:chain-length determining protein [Prevotella sp.]